MSLKVPKSCKGCFYRQKTGSITTCDYCYMTGESRGCSVEECTRYMVAPKGKAFRKEKLEKKLLACSCCGAPMKKGQTECSYCGSNFLIEKRLLNV